MRCNWQVLAARPAKCGCAVWRRVISTAGPTPNRCPGVRNFARADVGMPGHPSGEPRQAGFEHIL